MKTEPLEDGWTEAHSATIGRVDLVAKAANGSPSFLLMKSDSLASGLLDPDTVRELLTKSTPAPTPVSPADLMAAIHAASAPTQEKAMPESAVLKADDAKDAADAVIGDDAPLPTADEVLTDAPGDPDAIGSPAWEAVDAARARQALQLTVALQRLVTQSKDREVQEAAVGDDGDQSDVWTLEDVCCAIDAIIDMLAPFAVTEQAEADQGTADTLVKAAALIKAGRVLSSANEAKIRGAADALQSVLGSLPAPVEDVAKSEEETEVDTTIVKAKGDPQVAVYSADGKLVGTVDQADVNPIAEAAPPEGGDATEPAPEPEPEPAPVEPAPEAPVAPEDAIDGPMAKDAVPAPEPPVAPVADETVKKSQDDEIDLLKSSLTDALEVLRKQSERLELLEAQPMPGGPMLNGALPGADPIALRGQTDGQTSELTKAWQDEANPVHKQELQMQLAAHMVRTAPRLP